MKKYPMDFRESASFSKVSNEEINSKIESVLKEMENNGTPQHLMFFGDTMILIIRLHEIDGGGFEIIVSNNFSQSFYKNKIFK